MGKVMEDRGVTEWAQHETEKNAYIWTMPGTGLIKPVAKVKESRTLNLMPLQFLLH
jgi:hypothetical protein